ncbi:MAG: ribosome biogenesis GTPase YlqF [Christensenellaceae bacterium]|jgi:ribosome biogenesis GTPase A|nr:ribosome biogenesis GTPase YlqF [Christensenellaceae bacterium]
MKINWFPGHMTKALRMMEKEIKVVDTVIYVLDSRAPKSCVNPELTKLAGNKPIIYVLNKADMAPKAELSKWVKYFKSPNSEAVMLNSTSSSSAKIIISIIKKLLAPKIEAKAQKGITKIIRAMVVGVPNSGKSTLINNLCGKGKTMTGNKPGVTRGKQWVMVDGIEILDTPGTLWPSFEDHNTALNLAYIGSIKDDVLDVAELAFSFLGQIKGKFNTEIGERYKINIENTDETLEIFDSICRARKAILRDGDFDYERAARVIIDDFRHGKFGKIILDNL